MKDFIDLRLNKKEILLFSLIIFIVIILIFFLGFIAGAHYGEYQVTPSTNNTGTVTQIIVDQKGENGIEYSFIGTSPTNKTDKVIVTTKTHYNDTDNENIIEEEIIDKKSEKITENTTAVTEKTIKNKKSVNNIKPKQPKKVIKNNKRKTKKVKNIKPPPLKNNKPYTIQVGAFRSKTDALKIMGKLRSYGFNAYYERTNIAGKGVWFRVRVGHYKSKSYASKISKKITLKTGKQTFITISK